MKILEERQGRDPDILWYDLEVWVGKKRYWVDALRRKSDDHVSVFRVVLEGGARQTSRRSKVYKDIESAVLEELRERVKNPLGHERLKAKLLR